MNNRQFTHMPGRIAKLPRDHRGFPVPFFVTWFDGVPDFRIIRQEKMVYAIRHQKCWICGEKLGTHKAFVVGPMCGINRTSGEPPSHRECAIFAAENCPFMVNPRMKRNEKDLPENPMEVGINIKRNPGVALVWVTKKFKTFPVDNGFLIEMGPPLETLWFAEGRQATKEEILASIESGDCIVRKVAEEGGPDDVAEYERRKRDVLQMVARVA